jgi:hypothetical protein
MDKGSYMAITTSDSCFIQMQAAMLRLCLGCVLCSLLFEMHAAHAAQPESDPFAPGFDLISIKFSYSDMNRVERRSAYTEQQPVNSLDAKVGFFGATDKAHERANFRGISSLPDYINMEQVKDWVASIRWHMTADDNRASLSPQLPVESKETLIEIKPVDRSVWMMWHRALD